MRTGALIWEKTVPRMWVCMYMCAHGLEYSSVCGGGGSYNYPREGKKALETPIEHCTSNWTALNPNGRFFSSKAQGTQRLTICPFSWHTTPKPDVPITSRVACRSHPLAFNLCQFYKSAATKLQTLNRDRPGFWSRLRYVDCVAFHSPWASGVSLVKRRELSLPLKTVTTIKHNTQCRADNKNQASSSFSLSPKAILLLQPSFKTIGWGFVVKIQ